MSQQQPRRHQADPIKYGDVFNVSGDLASQPIAPRDASMMQSAENIVMGQTQKGGPAAVMQSAANFNERAGIVGHYDSSDILANQGVAVAETNLPGVRVVTEHVRGQLVGQYSTPPKLTTSNPGGALFDDAITIGEALEASVLTAGDKPVDQAGASAIAAAEVRAIGTNEVMPGGLAAKAQSAADMNARMTSDENKIKLDDILQDATVKLPADKQVTREDAEGVLGAEKRNKPDTSTFPGGVASSVVAAARLNQNKNM